MAALDQAGNVVPAQDEPALADCLPVHESIQRKPANPVLLKFRLPRALFCSGGEE